MLRVRTVVVVFVALTVLVTQVAGMAPTGSPWATEPAWAFKVCHITRDREIHLTHRPFLTCGQAKRVLLRLKGSRDTVPMACNHPRTVQGWRITAASKAPGGMISTYKRGRYSFQYLRPSTPHHSCDPRVGDEPAA